MALDLTDKVALVAAMSNAGEAASRGWTDEERRRGTSRAPQEGSQAVQWPPHRPTTQSSSGIGEAVARALAGAGAAVVVSSARSVDAGRAVAASLPRATYVQADIAVEEQAGRLVAAAVDFGGRLDVLVNNAGTTQVIPHDHLEAASLDVWRRIFDVNVFGTWAVTVAALPHLRRSGDGSVLNVTSMAGVRPSGSSIPYATSKAALNHLTALLAKVVGPEVRVNALAPGLVDTPWTEGWGAVRDWVRATAPLGRSATPADMADAALGILASRYMTGQVVIVDGGLHLT